VTKREQGLQVLEHLLGKQDFDRRQASETDYNRDFRTLTDEYCFATVWSRDGLEWKIRSMMCIAALAAQGLWSQLRYHTNSALNNGVSPEELKEGAIHLTVYIGFPKAAEALQVIEQVLKERDQPAA
jgi:4-carboxymuconolactone decarboxylase